MKPTIENEKDALYDDAVKVIKRLKMASAPMLQKHLVIGYMRANRIIDSLEVNGVIGKFDGVNPREILIECNTPLSPSASTPISDSFIAMIDEVAEDLKPPIETTDVKTAETPTEMTHEQAKEFCKSLEFGDILVNHWASDANPNKRVIFIKKTVLDGRLSIYTVSISGKGDAYFHISKGLNMTKDGNAFAALQTSSKVDGIVRELEVLMLRTLIKPNTSDKSQEFILGYDNCQTNIVEDIKELIKKIKDEIEKVNTETKPANLQSLGYDFDKGM